MKTLTSLFRPAVLLAALPAALAFSACGNDDNDNNTPAPDQGKVVVVHAAAAATAAITPVFDNQQGSSLTYTQNSGYLGVNVGSPQLRLVNGTGTTVVSRTLAVAKDQSYSVFVYSPTASIGSAELLSVTDDLTAPAANQAKIRLVHLAVGAPSPVRLTVPSAVPGTPGTDVTPDVAFGTASAFFAINAGSPTLTITSAGTPRPVVLTVGDGSGSGTGTKNYEAGKIYTILVRGIAGAGVAAEQQPKAVILQNN
ncbi:DUF4397 domain-containing protein [Hymenobacter sp. UYP22]|uniref:DUF4397 domain-containing protein n=1 Tax=Hymenobacter sp. UYP22 TaxID=3156348 RepID=UPI0033982496